MAETYITIGNTRFLLERAKDFDDSGRMINGHGYFLSVVKGRHIMAGDWYETRQQAETAAWNYESALMHADFDFT